ncbi:MAG: GAF domain-containing protein [Flavobacteriales bacterium]
MQAVPSLPQYKKRSEVFPLVMKQLTQLMDGERSMIANMANVAALLHSTFQFHWTGFYIVRNEMLVLGPFQGPVACTRIARGKGVCGTAWQQKTVLNIPDVELFPGHIACSALSKSELVVPVIRNGEVIAVLDIDSEFHAHFDVHDETFFTDVVKHLAANSDES